MDESNVMQQLQKFKNEFDKQFDALEQSLGKSTINNDKPRWFFPQAGSRYFYISDGGELKSYRDFTNPGSYSSEYKKVKLNCYETYKKAESALKQQEVMTAIRKASAESLKANREKLPAASYTIARFFTAGKMRGWQAISADINPCNSPITAYIGYCFGSKEDAQKIIDHYDLDVLLEDTGQPPLINIFE